MELFASEFKENVRESFRKMKTDIVELRNSVNEWIVFLNSNQREMKRKIYELDRRLRELEMERVAEMVKVNKE
ncbi:MAG: hypothetical protein NT001_04280 [Candidatus Woesearchaeota archaeon]|nr:hypothetical protein [Candidatus Woesearchaeota archaeon]